MTILFIWKERCKTPRLPIGKGNTQCKLAEQEGAKGTCNSDSHKQDYSICIRKSLHKPLFVTRILYGDRSESTTEVHYPIFCNKKNCYKKMTLNPPFRSPVPAPLDLLAQVSGENPHDSDSLFARRLHVSFRPTAGGFRSNRSGRERRVFSSHDMYFWLERPVWYMVMFQDKVV